MARKKKIEEPIIEEIEVKKELPEFYMLRVGETISDVAKKFGVSEETLKELNGDTVIGGNQIKLK